MKVRVDCVVVPSTTRRDKDPLTNADRPEDRLVMKVLDERSPNGDPQVEVSGPPGKVKAWLKRNGYDQDEYEVVEP